MTTEPKQEAIAKTHKYSVSRGADNAYTLADEIRKIDGRLADIGIRLALARRIIMTVSQFEIEVEVRCE